MLAAQGEWLGTILTEDRSTFVQLKQLPSLPLDKTSWLHWLFVSFSVNIFNFLKFPFPPSKVFHILFLALYSNSGHLFSLIVFKYICGVSVCLPKYINTTCSVWAVLLIYVFSELAIWHWITSWCALLWGSLFPPFSAFLVVLYVGLRPLALPPLMLACLLGRSLLRSCSSAILVKLCADIRTNV